MTKDSKKAQAIIAAWKKATATELWQVYDSFSKKKAEAREECRRLQFEMDGYAGRITSASPYFFSYTFVYKKDGKEWMMHITKGNNVTFCLE